MHARLLVACVLLLALSATRTIAVDIFSLPVAGNIRVGRTVSLSGQFSAESADVSAAAGFWLNWVNYQVGGVINNGSRYLFELVTWNDASDPSLVPLLYQTMAETQGVSAFFGPYSSTLNLAALNASKPYGIPFLISAGSDPRLFAGWTNNVGLLAQSTLAVGSCSAALISAGVKTVAFVLYSDTVQFSFTRAINNSLTAGGVRNVMYVIVNGTDFTDVIANLTALKPDVVVLGLIADTGNPFLVQLRANVAWQPKLIWVTTAGALVILGSQLTWEPQLAISSQQWSPKLTYTDPYFGDTMGFVTAFNASFGKIPSDIQVTTFAAGMTLMDAITRSPSLDAADIVAALRATDIPSTWFGPIKFQATGAINATSTCGQLIGSTLDVFAPVNLANEPFRYPGIPPRPPAPKKSQKRRNALIIGLTVGLSVLLIVGIVIAIFFSKMYHCVFLEKRAEGESTETWG